MSKRDFLLNIPKLKDVYVIHSQTTRLPLVLCHEETADDYIMVYTREESAKEKAKELLAHKVPVVVVKCHDQEISQLFGSLKGLGVNAIQFVGRNAGEDYLVQVSEFLRFKDFSNQPLHMRPVENPTLQLSLLYFLQEYRRAADAPDRGDVQELSEEVYVNMAKARFLICAQPIKEGEKKGQSSLMLIKNQKGEAYLPIFTDVFEVRRFTKGQPPKQMIAANMTKVLDILGHGEALGVALNAASCNYTIETAKMYEIWEAFGEES